MSTVCVFILPTLDPDVKALQAMYPGFQNRLVVASNLVVNRGRATSLEWEGSDLESKTEPLSVTASALDYVDAALAKIIFFAPIVKWHEEIQAFVAKSPGGWQFPFIILSHDVPKDLAETA